MFERFVARDIPTDVTFETLRKAVRLNGDDALEEDVARLSEMFEEASAIAWPKAVYGIARIEEKGEDYIVVDGQKITSRHVREKVGELHRIFPFVMTCGVELEEWSQQFTDPLEQYWADAIKLQYLGCVDPYLTSLVRERYIPEGYLARMSPGELKEWPLPQQDVLFRIIEKVTEDVGVHLTDSFLMLPSKSRSGFFFASETKYESCSLCTIFNCPGRRAPYQPPESK